jgi:hypothetical protein
VYKRHRKGGGLRNFNDAVSIWSPTLYMFCSTGSWTQGLHPEPLLQPYFVKGVSKQGLMNYLPWLHLTMILLISTGVSHRQIWTTKLSSSLCMQCFHLYCTCKVFILYNLSNMWLG